MKLNLFPMHEQFKIGAIHYYILSRFLIRLEDIVRHVRHVLLAIINF
ncbi:hypothetical protein [Coxiella-like endosymbiont]|nr:hypothetical protein [Coxiella-like endosymbiont]